MVCMICHYFLKHRFHCLAIIFLKHRFHCLAIISENPRFALPVIVTFLVSLLVILVSGPSAYQYHE